MNKKDRDEFVAVITAVARAYGANREDVIAAAKALPSAPPSSRGRKSIDDGAALGEAKRMQLKDPALTDWAAALAVAKRLPGHSVEATAQRLFRRMRKPRYFYRRYPDAARIGALPDEPFERARLALAEIEAKWPD